MEKGPSGEAGSDVATRALSWPVRGLEYSTDVSRTGHYAFPVQGHGETCVGFLHQVDVTGKLH